MRPTLVLALLTAACTIEVPEVKLQVSLSDLAALGVTCGVSLTDKDCLQTELCHQYGVCTAHEGVCVLGVTRDEQCSELHGALGYLPCDDQGQCTALGGWCQATRSEDCKASAYCQNYGECEVRSGYCVIGAASDEDCKSPHGGRNVSQCKDFGRCMASPESGKCVAVSTEDCEASSVCSDYGYCTLSKSGQCVDSL